MKRLILNILLVLLLAGVGGGAGLVVSMPTAVAAGSSEDEAAPGDPVYVEFNPIMLPIVGDGRVEQIISVVVALEMVDQEAADRAIALAPRLNDAYLQALYGRLHADNVIVNGVVDLRIIKRELVRESNHVMGHGVVLDALVQMVSQRHL